MVSKQDLLDYYNVSTTSIERYIKLENITPIEVKNKHKYYDDSVYSLLDKYFEYKKYLYDYYTLEQITNKLNCDRKKIISICNFLNIKFIECLKGENQKYIFISKNDFDKISDYLSTNDKKQYRGNGYLSKDLQRMLKVNKYTLNNVCKLLNINPKIKDNSFRKVYDEYDLIILENYLHPINVISVKELAEMFDKCESSIIKTIRSLNIDYKEIVSKYYINKSDIVLLKEYFDKTKLTGVSTYELELVDFVKSFELFVETNNRSICKPLELDIYVPSKNVAIEFDGLYYHSDKPNNYHLNKTMKCEEKGIRLIHIFEDEWIENKEICKSIISSALGIYKEKIYARKCEILEISSMQFNNFCEENHIQGKCPSSKRFGLFYNNELVQVVGFSKPRFAKECEWELTRMCTKKNTQVIGGFSKLMNYFGQDCISYVDRRLFNGKGYYSSNFKFIKYNKPQYFYCKDQHRYYRMNFQKKLLKDKLTNFDPSLTEEENMLNNRYTKIYDCGTIKVKYTHKNN